METATSDHAGSESVGPVVPCWIPISISKDLADPLELATLHGYVVNTSRADFFQNRVTPPEAHTPEVTR
ncbi:MAG: hypothetical protein ACK55I_18375 [bacterium]